MHPIPQTLDQLTRGPPATAQHALLKPDPGAPPCPPGGASWRTLDQKYTGMHAARRRSPCAVGAGARGAAEPAGRRGRGAHRLRHGRRRRGGHGRHVRESVVGEQRHRRRKRRRRQVQLEGVEAVAGVGGGVGGAAGGRRGGPWAERGGRGGGAACGCRAPEPRAKACTRATHLGHVCIYTLALPAKGTAK